MNQDENTEFLPEAIVVFARQRIAESIAAYSRDDRPWYIRWFVSKGLSRRPVPAILINYFSECDLELQKCAGKLMGEWLVTETQVISQKEDKSHEDLSNPIVDYIQIPLIKFALSAAADKCVVNELNVDGTTTRVVHVLPNGIKSSVLGQTIGQPRREK